MSPNVMRLRLFSFSLSGKARDWLDTVLSDIVITCDSLIELFLDKFFPTLRTERLILEIQEFRQHPNESLFEAYERFSDLIRKCPYHRMHTDQILRTFYHGLNEINANALDIRAPEEWIIDIEPEEVFKLIN